MNHCCATEWLQTTKHNFYLLSDVLIRPKQRLFGQIKSRYFVYLRWLFVQLNENALSRAQVGGFNNAVEEAIGNRRKGSGTPGIVHRRAGLGYIGDAVLQLNEHVRTVVHAQSIAGAQILIDPHPHERHGIAAVPGALLT